MTHHAKAKIDRPAVLAAMRECDELGREAFLARHGYRKSNRFTVEHEGRMYDSKAILGVAFGYQYDCEPLKPGEHSGGAEHCATLFRKLGFTVKEGGRRWAGKVASLGRRVARAAMTATVAALMTVGLVSCTKSKLDEAAPARELYSPSYVFRKSVEYVERECDRWHVLSAKHGLVDPDEVLEPYDETLSGAPKATRERWAAEVREQLKARYEGKRVKFVLMAGRSYAGAVEGIDEEDWVSAEVEEPMKGLGTGHRRRWLAQNT